MEARTSMGGIEHTLEYYGEINPSRNKYGTQILWAVRFKTAWEFIQCCLTSNEYKGIGPADMRILYDVKIFGGEEIMQNLLQYLSFYFK